MAIYPRLLEVIRPSDGVTLPRAERIDRVDDLIDALELRMSGVEPGEVAQKAGLISDAAALSIGQVYRCLAGDVNVSHPVMAEAYDRLVELATVVGRAAERFDYRAHGVSNTVGAIGVLGVLTTVIGGMAEGHLPLGYAILGDQRLSSPADALPSIVDLYVKVGKKNRKVQVIAGSKAERRVCASDICVVSALRLARAAVPAANKPHALLKVHADKRLPERPNTYRELSLRLGI